MTRTDALALIALLTLALVIGIVIWIVVRLYKADAKDMQEARERHGLKSFKGKQNG